MITMIAAAAENNELGKNNSLPWHLPDDFKRFKALTTGHHIIMGRKTFESFPKPLPNRTHVVISRQKDYNPEGCIVVSSLQDAIAICPKNEELFLIGGGQIYALGMSYCDKIELTRVHHTFEADAFLPEINPEDWLLSNSEYHAKDPNHPFAFTYETYLKK
ncbi:dihydrofolate reductase [Flavobacterium crassostreae]|uniref:Dihydrofolate reductase n=1 Tax=Flavobacterium crassostreae TaxID=1763534 RepID=A0A1B9DZQ9_9FLAO|nr:dihydrofolate reductase [Flavobacterium crassostreae]OCB75183.1 diacylglycerol kinase [Flavobacterium crassostreae]